MDISSLTHQRTDHLIHQFLIDSWQGKNYLRLEAADHLILKGFAFIQLNPVEAITELEKVQNTWLILEEMVEHFVF